MKIATAGTTGSEFGTEWSLPADRTSDLRFESIAARNQNARPRNSPDWKTNHDSTWQALGSAVPTGCAVGIEAATGSPNETTSATAPEIERAGRIVIGLALKVPNGYFLDFALKVPNGYFLDFARWPSVPKTAPD